MMVGISGRPLAIPTGYATAFRRVGTIRVLSNGNVKPFVQSGNLSDRTYFYQDTLANFVTNGTSSSFTDVTANAQIPEVVTTLACVYSVTTEDTFNETVAVGLRARPIDQGNIVQLPRFYDGASANETSDIAAAVWLPVDAGGYLQYEVVGSSVGCSLGMIGYQESV